MEQYQIDVNDSRVYPMGLTRTDGGIHVSTVAAAKACSLLLFVKEDKNGKEARFREVRNIPFPEEGKTGHVWSMTLNGAFDDLYYAFEADGKRFSDPYGRSFAGRERWGRLSHAKRLLCHRWRSRNLTGRGTGRFIFHMRIALCTGLMCGG